MFPLPEGEGQGEGEPQYRATRMSLLWRVAIAQKGHMVSNHS